MVEVTLRTIQGRLLLRPTRATTRTVAGVIGRAQRKYGMQIHALVAMGNHAHLLISPRDAEQMARFMNHVDANIARKVGKMVDWREKFWGRRYRAIVISDEPEAQVARLRYLLSHGAKEGFVMSPKEWPGVHAALSMLDGTMVIEGIWHDATAAYRDRVAGKNRSAKDYEQPERIHLSPLPCWRDLTPEAHQRQVADLVEGIEQETRARHQRAGTVPLGKAKMLAANPHDRPRRVKRSPAPAFHAASKKARVLLRDAYRLFVAAYREAAEKLRRGAWPVAFPSGCFPPALPFVRALMVPG